MKTLYITYQAHKFWVLGFKLFFRDKKNSFRRKTCDNSFRCGEVLEKFSVTGNALSSGLEENKLYFWIEISIVYTLKNFLKNLYMWSKSENQLTLRYFSESIQVKLHSCGGNSVESLHKRSHCCVSRRMSFPWKVCLEIFKWLGPKH